eukprot:SAG22_NODE_1612_length_3998_cov_12.441652_6_plen_216_part_00
MFLHVAVCLSSFLDFLISTQRTALDFHEADGGLELVLSAAESPSATKWDKLYGLLEEQVRTWLSCCCCCCCCWVMVVVVVVLLLRLLQAHRSAIAPPQLYSWRMLSDTSVVPFFVADCCVFSSRPSLFTAFPCVSLPFLAVPLRFGCLQHAVRRAEATAPVATASELAAARQTAAEPGFSRAGGRRALAGLVAELHVRRGLPAPPPLGLAFVQVR